MTLLSITQSNFCFSDEREALALGVARIWHLRRLVRLRSDHSVWRRKQGRGGPKEKRSGKRGTTVRHARQVSLKSWGIAGEFGPETMGTAGTRREAEFPLQVKPREIP